MRADGAGGRERLDLAECGRGACVRARASRLGPARRFRAWSRLGWALAPLLAASPAVAQGLPAEARPDSVSVDDGADRRSPLVAALLQAALPPLPLGYAYAGDLGRGLLPTGLMVGGATLFLVEAAEVFDWNDPDFSEPLFWVGFTALVGGYAFGIVDAAATARRHNERASGVGATIAIGPTRGGLAVRARIALR